MGEGEKEKTKDKDLYLGLPEQPRKENILMIPRFELLVKLMSLFYRWKY
jgi:hypothetical protein